MEYNAEDITNGLPASVELGKNSLTIEHCMVFNGKGDSKSKSVVINAVDVNDKKVSSKLINIVKRDGGENAIGVSVINSIMLLIDVVKLTEVMVDITKKDNTTMSVTVFKEMTGKQIGGVVGIMNKAFLDKNGSVVEFEGRYIDVFYELSTGKNAYEKLKDLPADIVDKLKPKTIDHYQFRELVNSSGNNPTGYSRVETTVKTIVEPDDFEDDIPF